jgi:benzoate membrane transport protein
MTQEPAAEPAAGAFRPLGPRGPIGVIELVNAFVANLFAASAAVAIVLTAARQGGLTEADIASWLFGSFFFNGLISLFFCIRYRQPLLFLWTIPGTVLVGQALEHASFPQVIGTYYATGALLVLLGASGWVRKCMRRLPMPIVMAMVAGVFMQICLNVIFAIRDGMAIAAPMTLVFLLLSAFPRLGRVVPPPIGALVTGVIAVAVTGGLDLPGPFELALAKPIFHVPEFSWPTMVELVIPLAITVLAAQNAQGFAVLEAAGHQPPVDAATTACGVGSLITATVGSVSTCLTGPANAILVSSPARERHRAAGIAASLLAMLFGLGSPMLTRVMLATPRAFIATLAGLVLLRVLERSFVVAFGSGITLGALVTFLVTVANIPILTIGAPFWALLAGYAVAWLFERDALNKDSAINSSD